MRPEIRNNLIFLALLLALMAPGAVILFNKKSQPGERPIGSPDPVRRTTAYMDPYPAESVERLAPLQTLQWVSVLALADPPLPDSARDKAVRVVRPLPPETPAITRLAPVGGSGNVGTSAPFRPVEVGPVDAQVISDGRWFQVVSAGPGPAPDTAVLRVIVWDEDADPARGTFDARTPLGPAPILATHPVSMPRPIRHDLQDAGFVSPPQQVVVLDLAIPRAATELTLRYAGRHRREQSARFPPLQLPAAPPEAPSSNR